MIRDALRAANPRIEEVSILEIRAPFPESPKRATLAWGVRRDHRFQGDFRDELFGLFVLNDSLTRIEATLDILPTPRWLDYEFHLRRVSIDSVYLVRKGATHGDLPMARAYAW